MQQRAALAPVDRRLEGVGGFEKPADLNRDPDGARRRHGAAGDHLGQVLAVEELHRDVEIRTVGGVLVHLRHLSIDLPQLLLILGALALRLDDLACLLVVADRNDLQRHAAAGARVGGDEDVRHAATARRSEDCVRPDLKARRRDHGCEEIGLEPEPGREVEHDADQPIERMVGKGITWKLTGQLAIQSIRLLTVAILARFLSPEEYGTAAIAVALAAFAPTVADMGIGSALVQIDKAPRMVRSTAFWTSIAFGTALFLIFAAASGPIEAFLGKPGVGVMVVAGGLTLAIYSIGSTSQAVFMRGMHFRSIELRSWVALLVGSAVGITAAASGAGAWGSNSDPISVFCHSHQSCKI